MKKELITKKAPEALGPYSQGIETDGLVFVSGQLPIDPATGEFPEKISKQAEQSLDNIIAILGEAELTLDDVVKTTIFIKDMDKFGEVNAVCEKYFSKPFPARACIGVASLPKNADLEIEVIAAKRR